MKKIVLVMAVLMLAAPAWAVTVDIWAVQVGDTDEVEIWYETDGNLPRAFGLNITASDNVNIVACEPAMVGECDDVTRGYGIFPGTIVIVDGNVTDYNTPVAPSGDPGAEGTGLDTNEIVVEMGSLYTGANTPDTSGLLCTITVAGECTVNISGNAARTGTGSGGIGVVMENPAETPTVNFTGTTVTMQVAVPDVLAMDLTEATTAITGVGLVVASPVTYECNETEAAEEILAQAPAGGTMVPPGSEVDLWVSDGQPTVPNVLGQAEATAIANIEAVDYLSVGNICYECSDTIANGNVVYTNPLAGLTTCGTAVQMVVSTGSCPEECYAGQPDYAQWAAAGKPECWCYDRQCHGDADGKKEGSFLMGYWYVGGDDLDIMSLGWKVLDPPKGPGILHMRSNDCVPAACADFARDKEGSFLMGYWRIGSNDLDEMSIYWKKKEGSGEEALADCDPNNREP